MIVKGFGLVPTSSVGVPGYLYFLDEPFCIPYTSLRSVAVTETGNRTRYQDGTRVSYEPLPSLWLLLKAVNN